MTEVRHRSSQVSLPTTLAVLLAVQVTAAVVAALAAGEGPLYLFQRQFWLDELLTMNIWNVGNPTEQVEWLSRGMELNPPAFYFALDLWANIMPRNEWSLRLFVFFCSLAGSAAAVVVLQRFTDGWTAIFSVATAWLSHETMLVQTFDGRYYAPLYAAAGWFAVELTSPRRGWSSDLALGLAAAVLVSTHYFAVFTGGLMLLGYAIAIARHPGSFRGSLRRIGAATLGLCWLFVFVPLVLKQKAAMADTPTWLGPLGFSDLLTFLRSNLAPVALVVAVSIGYLSKRKNPADSPDAASDVSIDGARSAAHADGAIGAIGAMLATLALPLVLILFSFVVQPAYAPRYGATTLFGIAAVVAWATSRASRRTQAAGLVVCFAFAVITLVGFRSRFHPPLFQMDRPIAAALASVRSEVSSDVPLVAYRYLGFQAWHYAGLKTDQAHVLMPEPASDDESQDGRPSLLDAHQWTIFRRLADEGAMPAPIAPSELAKHDRFYYLSDGSDLRLGLRAQLAPTFHIRMIPTDTSLALLEMTRREPQ